MNSLSKQALALIALGVALLVAVLILLGVWRHAQTAAAEHRVESAQGAATMNSAHDAIETESNVSAAQTAGEDLTRRNDADIRAAKGADQAVAHEARDAGLAALCRRPAYRDAPRCAPKGK